MAVGIHRPWPLLTETGEDWGVTVGISWVDIVFDSFLPRDASAERGNAIVNRPSVCLSVRLSVCL